MSSNQIINIEQIKKEKDGLDVIADIYIHAVLGEKIPSENLELLRWYGIYASDENQNSFELKIPLNMGELNLLQLKTLAKISKKFSDNNLIFCDEQKIELKNIRFFDLPEVLKELKEVELNTFFEAGHTVRRVITCPLNGIDSQQIIDVSQIAQSLDNTFIGNKKYSNLPNKLQIALSGYEEGCALNYIPDISFNASKDDKDKVIFKLKILNKTVGFIYPSQVLNTAVAIAKIYRDFGFREEIKKSTFEFFINDLGFARFFDILQSSINFNIKPIFIDLSSTNSKKPRMGVHDSKTLGKSYIGCVIENKKQKSENIEKLTFLLEKFEASKIKITHKGNIIILDTPTKTAQTLAKELEKIDFNPFV